VDVAESSLIVEMAGTEDKIEALVELLKPYGISELARTGVIAMARGMQNTHDGRHATPAGGKRTRSIDAPAAAALPPS
jgi:acetolactate synthase-1/3 small subunit